MRVKLERKYAKLRDYGLLIIIKFFHFLYSFVLLTLTLLLMSSTDLTYNGFDLFAAMKATAEKERLKIIKNNNNNINIIKSNNNVINIINNDDEEHLERYYALKKKLDEFEAKFAPKSPKEGM